MVNLNSDDTASVSTVVQPDVLIIPGLNNSGPGHWQTLWEARLPRARRVDLGCWDDPHRNTWVSKLALAIGRSDRPVVLVAHSLGCHVVAWWAEYEAAFNAHVRKPEPCPVIGALLVAPPDVEENPADRRLTRFAPLPPSPLPFPATVVTSRDDSWLSIAQGRRLAQRWGARLVDAGAVGHINTRSAVGEWAFGLDQLRQLSPASVPPGVMPDTGDTPAAISVGAPLFQWGAPR
ncbi:alpha/beta fold hydrolase [Novosphingobium sp.]|uniref:RBBP9/YdeN family alpha/beta hydrolase n=1 Tax=Novosphingobium sp. TaxID=1874826 RepID=UPI00333FC17A